MKSFNVTRYVMEHLSARIFLTFSVLIIATSLSFTVFFYRYQSGALTERTVSEGELLARLLAQNARLGVFTENARLLGVPVDGIMENHEVISVEVYSVDGRILVSRSRTGHGSSPAIEKWDAETAKMIKEASAPFHFRNNGNFIFLTKVELKPYAEEEDPIYFSTDGSKSQGQPIGFARVVLDGDILLKKLNALLFNSVLIGLAFLVIGSMTVFIISRRVMKPLSGLTEGVITLGREGKFERIAVERDDEIGKLAAAFNVMVDSLSKREAEKGELEEKLRQSQKMEAIGTMAGGVAHDFNNMLTAINGFGTLLKLGLSHGSKLEFYTDQILSAVEKAANLTSRLLTFSRKHIISPRRINLDDIIRNLENMLARLITEDIELLFRLEAGHAAVLADPGQMELLLINLVTNARDAMPQGGTTTISTSVVTLDGNFVKKHELGKEGRYLSLIVSDNGFGIPEKDRKKIFDPFFTTKEIGKGTGLGLSMVYGIVTQHDGVIEVDSEPGRGTSFKIFLPLTELPPEDRQRAVPKICRGNLETILVAEDDDAVRSFLKRMLEMNGYKVIEATNGEEAVEKYNLNQDRVNLVLLDVIMPRKNGRQVFDQISGIKPDIKALFMSGYTDEVIDFKDAHKKGISLISKPLQPDELLAKLREVLES